MLKKFILKSNKIYIILGIGIMLCVLTLTANISYGLGQQQAAGYSKNYLETYAFSVWEYTICNANEMDLNNAFSYAETRTNWEFLTDKERHQNMINNINRVMEEKSKTN